MPSRRRRKSKSLAVQAVELGVAVPQVIAHRALRMAMAGASPSARDRKEFQRMGTEKIFALGESWNAMALEAFLANQRMALSAMQTFWFPWLGTRTPESASKQMSDAALDILRQGMAPVHRRAVANARRLGRARRRARR